VELRRHLLLLERLHLIAARWNKKHMRTFLKYNIVIILILFMNMKTGNQIVM
jgi:hypothetical protein